MKIEEKKPPRLFSVGEGTAGTVHADCGTVTLETGEQVTFATGDGKEYDVCRTEWGFYATPSTNGRLRQFGFRTAVVRNRQGRIYVVLVERDRLDAFERYLRDDPHDIVAWLDDDTEMERLFTASSRGFPPEGKRT